jgi:hypothetical protein
VGQASCLPVHGASLPRVLLVRRAGRQDAARTGRLEACPTPNRYRGTAAPARFVVGLAGILFAFAAGIHAATPASPKAGAPATGSIRWIPDPADTNRVAVEVFGLSAPTLRAVRQSQWTPAQWERLLSLHAGQGDWVADMDVPAMLGVYNVGPDAIRFAPRFPLEAGVGYRAVFQPDRLPDARGAKSPPVVSVFKLPPRPATPSTVVSQVYPSGDLLPENLLKFYLHFSAPMRRGHIYDHIHLLNEAAKEIELPFLEIDEELWNPAMTRLTLFIDPGRIKRGVKPLEEVGPALEEGKRFTLVIDQAWRDATGLPLKETYRKPFRVGPPDREAPNPGDWKIQSPQADSREPLGVTFPESMEHALAQRMIRVATQAGALVPGETTLEDLERHWRFVPAHPWSRGPHRILVQTTIEDLAGNNIGKLFEVDLFESVQPRLTNSTVTLPFEVR